MSFGRGAKRPKKGGKGREKEARSFTKAWEPEYAHLSSVIRGSSLACLFQLALWLLLTLKGGAMRPGIVVGMAIAAALNAGCEAGG